MAIDVKDGESRIIYLEPNDAMDDIDGVPMTPDYSDLCIAFNLIVEVLPRFKTTAEQGKDYSGKYCIYWRSKSPLNGQSYEPGTYVSFLKGKDGFLTTYYTDTNYEDVVRENIVEGLGVENVTVAFENYYTPTVTIKFVDQRGSSLFGREEATHNDDKLTIDNIFGAFFTAPYPKFKLQIKGFYGQAVTLQLTCSGFKGNLNSQTGNFEATATFIGYSYSLLTDIPFQYIVAAPFCEYVGREYWLQNVNSPDWELYGGQQMITIYDLMENINHTFTDDKLLKIIGDSEEVIIKSGETEKAELIEVIGAFNSFKNVLQSSTGNHVSNYTGANIDNEQLLLFTDSDKIAYTGDIASAWDRLSTAVKKYNEDYPSNEIPTSSMPNETVAGGKLAEMATIHIFDVKTDDENKGTTVTIVGKSGNVISESDLLNLELNTKDGKPRKLTDTLVKRLIGSLTSGETENHIRKNAYLFELHDFVKRANDRMQYIDDEARSIEMQAERNYIELAKDKLEIVPYIGNIFKMIMAHIETFVFMMYTVFNRIEQQSMSGQRTPGFLNVMGNGTLADVTSNGKIENVPAWPLVTRANTENNAFTEHENENTIGWVGDFSPHFEEEKLVRALFLACKKTAGSNYSNREQETNVSYVPITPADVNMVENVFQGNIEASISSLAGMLGLRSAQLFGIMEKSAVDNSIATVMGRMDAYNFYLHNPSKSEIKEKIIDVAGNKSLSNKLYDIMLCKPEEDSSGDTFQGDKSIQRHKFEKVRGVAGAAKDRHPIYIENGSMLKYVHFYTENKHPLVPSVVITFDLYSKRYEYVGQNNGGPYFNYEYYNNTIPDTLINCDSKTITSENTAANKKDYINGEMFNVETNPSKVEGILKRYDELKSKNFKILGEQFSDDFGKVLDRYWKTDDSNYKKIVDGFSRVMYKKYEDAGIDKTAFGPDTRKKMSENVVSYSGDGQWGDGLSLDSVFVPEINIFTPDLKGCSLFASYFYYNQNTIKERSVRDRVKALLILHALLSFTNPPNLNFYSSSKMCGTVQSTTVGYALLLGGLFWREKYFDEHSNTDPVVYSSPVIEKDEKKIWQMVYKKSGKEYSFYYQKPGYSAKLAMIDSKYDTVWYNVKTSSLSGGVNLDWHIKNALIKRFEEFADGKCQTLIGSLELRSKGTSKSENISSVALKELIDSISKKGTDQVEWPVRKEIANNAFVNFFDAYAYYSRTNIEECPVVMWMNDTNTTVQNVLKWLYCGKAVIMDTSARRFVADAANQSHNVEVSSSNVKSYLNGFSSALSKIVESVSETTISNDNESDTKHGDLAEFDRDVAVPIYMYLKSIWDKWLVASNKMDPYNSEFSVRNFFNNFVFIDSFYRNIATRFMMNCQILLDRYDANNQSTKDYSVFKYIGDITSDHHCMFLAVPDFIDGMSNEAKEKARLALNSIFKPIPYAEMRDMTLNNRFVIIYIPKLSETPSEINNYADDSFNIWSYNEKDGVAPKILKQSGSTDEGLSSYGYYVPSFGLAYGRQHNHLFKNLNLNMETPIITSAVINTLSHIAKQGAANSHAIAFVGQDIYPVFSNYSYICEFEMMGCAQIQPLMYFQLMNVPMWRGTYMIFNVTHTMTPGNMVTKVRAMKLSNRAVPYSNAWFKKNLNYDPKGGGGDADCDDANNGSGNYPGVYTGPVVQKKYIDMEAVRRARNSNTYRNGAGTLRSVRPCSKCAGIVPGISTGTGECTCGPQTWIQEGLKARSVNSKIPGNLRPQAWTDNTSRCALGNWGFEKIRSFNSISEFKAFKGAQFGDIATAFTNVSGHQHMCMWDGKQWVSDFVQNGIWVYDKSGYGLSSEKEKPAIWRFSDDKWYNTFKKYLS